MAAMDRRAFVAALAAGLGGGLAACAGRARLTARPLAPAARHPQAPSSTAIELGGVVVGWARVFGGGRIAAQGIADYVPGHPPPLPNAPRLFRDLVIVAGAGMAPGFYAWAARCLAPGPEPARTGTIISVDAQGREIARRRWRGHVDRLEFPAVARHDCAPATLRVQIAVEDARAENPRLQPRRPPTAPPPEWRRCDFRFKIAGLEEASRRITSVSAFTCERRSRIGPAGQIEMQPPTFAPFTITVPAGAGAPFAAWARAGGRRDGALAFRGPNGNVLLTLRMTGITAQPGPPGAFRLGVRGAALE